MKKTYRYSLIAFVLFFALCSHSPFAFADTDGSELQVVQPEKLEIQLGLAWAGVEFQLKTDSGLYPNSIAVGEDGVLRLEMGGSSSYILSCLNSNFAVPQPEEPSGSEAEVNISAKDNLVQSPTPEETAQPVPVLPTTAVPDSFEKNPQAEEALAGIPLKHIVILGVGMLVAVSFLIGLRVSNARREEDYFDDSDE